jgi:hypothetical protein
VGAFNLVLLKAIFNFYGELKQNICTVCDRIFSGFPAKIYCVCMVYIHGSGQPYLCAMELCGQSSNKWQLKGAPPII